MATAKVPWIRVSGSCNDSYGEDIDSDRHVNEAQSTDFSNTLTGLDKGARADDMKPLAERQKIQSETQRTLMDGGPSRNSNAARTAYSLASPSLSSTGSTSPAPPIAKKPEAISLAAFMGGRATGPMLRKHAPQQDAHDPTQFEQHTKFNAPHPVFGRGGVAMPGMTSTGRSAPIPSPVGLSHNDHRESPSPVGPSSRRDRTLSTPPGTKRHAEGAQEHTLTPKLENGFGSRERAVSTPGRSSPVRQCNSRHPLSLTVRPLGALVSQCHGPPRVKLVPNRQPKNDTLLRICVRLHHLLGYHPPNLVKNLYHARKKSGGIP